MRGREISTNPYAAPAGNAADNFSGLRTVVLVLGGLASGVGAVAAAGVFFWAAYYRIEPTDAFGRSLTPPPIPLGVADGVMVGSFLVGVVLAAAAVVALNMAVRWSNKGSEE
jgi:hypothetical protein